MTPTPVATPDPLPCEHRWVPCPDCTPTPTPLPCEHRWRWLDAYDVWQCQRCKATESPDDDPGDAA